MIAVIHRGEKFKEMLEQVQQKRAEFIAQEIRCFDLETIRGKGHKLVHLTGMAV